MMQSEVDSVQAQSRGLQKVLPLVPFGQGRSTVIPV